MRTITYYLPSKKAAPAVPTVPYYVDGLDPRFTFWGNWQYDPSDSDVIWKNNHGYYAYPNEQVAVSLTFTGQRFTIWAPSTSQPGVTGAATYVLVDGNIIAQPSQAVDNSDTSVPNNQSWAWYTSPVLPYGEHTVTLGFAGDNSGFIAFDGFGIEPTAVDNTPRLVDLIFRGTNKFGGDQTLFIDVVQVLDEQGNPVDAGLFNADFRYPFGANGPYQYLNGNYDPKLGWIFGGGSGIATNGSAFGPPNTPDGPGCMFIQGATTSYQTMHLPPGRYTVSFLSGQRNDNQANTMEVYAGTTLIMAEFGPTQYQGFLPYTTAQFTVS